MIQAIDVCVNPFFPEFKDKYSRLGYLEIPRAEAARKREKAGQSTDLLQSMDEAKSKWLVWSRFALRVPSTEKTASFPRTSLSPSLILIPNGFSASSE